MSFYYSKDYHLFQFKIATIFINQRLFIFRNYGYQIKYANRSAHEKFEHTIFKTSNNFFNVLRELVFLIKFVLNMVRFDNTI